MSLPNAVEPPARNGTAAIEMRSITKRFGDVVAVDGLDLEVADGELFAMLGPSGSGKTTVLRMIAGFEAPTSGAISLSGIDVTDQPPSVRNVNTVFQNYALFPHLSVRQNVEYGLKVRGVGRADRRSRAGQMLELVHLSNRADARISQLSGGQQQRVALARALAVGPRVLLLDEPLGALDLKLRHQMQIELRAIQREVGITFVFVTHDQDEALTLCDRLAVFNEGRIEQIGTAREVYTRPASSFVADFVGTSNLLDHKASRLLVGRSGTFTIRPECITIGVAGPESDAAHGRVRANVNEVVYAGAVTRTVVDVAPDVSLVCLSLNGTHAALQDLRRGDPVVLDWHDDAVLQVGPV